MYGKHHTDKTRKQISNKMKGLNEGGKNPSAKKVFLTDSDYNIIKEFGSIKEMLQDDWRKVLKGRNSDYFLRQCLKTGKCFEGYYLLSEVMFNEKNLRNC